jgi:malate/lactate dehydrogenase
MCISMPGVSGRAGVVRSLPIDLSEREADALRRSAATLRGVIRTVFE